MSDICEPTETGLAISLEDQRAAQGLYEKLRKGNTKLISPEGEVKLLPASLYGFLVELLGALHSGKCVNIVQNQAKLTTVEAANMLGVSRQFLVNLLNRNEIPHHMVGTHRRIYAQDLIRYQHKRDARRIAALDKLSKAESEEDIYENVPLNPDAH